MRVCVCSRCTLPALIAPFRTFEQLKVGAAARFVRAVRQRDRKELNNQEILN